MKIHCWTCLFSLKKQQICSKPENFSRLDFAEFWTSGHIRSTSDAKLLFIFVPLSITYTSTLPCLNQVTKPRRPRIIYYVYVSIQNNETSRPRRRVCRISTSSLRADEYTINYEQALVRQLV